MGAQWSLRPMVPPLNPGEACILVRGDVVELMDPKVGRVLDALGDGEGLVMGAVVGDEGLPLEGGWPPHRLARLGLHGEAAVELGAAALVYVREVQEERVQPRAPRREARRVLRTRRRVFFSTCGPGLGRGR